MNIFFFFFRTIFFFPIGKDLLGERLTVEHARGPSRRGDSRGGGGGSGGGRDRDYGRSRRVPAWIDKYGPPTRTEYRLIVENLSSRVSWQDLKVRANFNCTRTGLPPSGKILTFWKVREFQYFSFESQGKSGKMI